MCSYISIMHVIIVCSYIFPKQAQLVGVLEDIEGGGWCYGTFWLPAVAPRGPPWPPVAPRGPPWRVSGLFGCRLWPPVAPRVVPRLFLCLAVAPRGSPWPPVALHMGDAIQDVRDMICDTSYAIHHMRYIICDTLFAKQNLRYINCDT